MNAQPWKPYKFQVKAVKFLLDRAGAGLWLDPGLGKTSIVLAALTALKEAGNLRRALVVAPLRVATLTWPDEIQKWADFNHLRYEVLHGSGRVLSSAKSDIHIINPEGLFWLLPKFSKRDWPYDVLIVDESTKFKNWSSQRTKMLRTVVGNFQRRWTLTGTPAPNGLQDLFSQVYIMDGGAALGQYITKFRNNYMYQGGYLGYEWFPRPGAWLEVGKRLKNLVMRLAAEDYIDMPPKVDNMIPVELPAGARKLYNKLEQDFIVELNDGIVTAASAAALSMKLRQATNGVLYNENEGDSLLHEEKFNALTDLLEDLQGSPLLCAVSFLSEVRALKARFGNAPYLGGGVSDTNATQIIRDWNAGKLPLLLVHPTSVAHGLNMQQAANHVCWFGLTWNLEEYHQLVRRVWRQGQKEKVIVHHLIAKDTMDEVVLEALRGKDRTQSGLLSQLKVYAEAHVKD